MVKELVERIRQKDQRAMSQFYQMYVEELSSVCYRYVPSEEDAKDVLQNSFVKIFTSLQTIDYRSEEALRGWMKRVVANEALSFLRKRKKLLFVEMVVNLYVFEDYSHRQIAELLGISEKTSASQFYYAKRLLARKIGEMGKMKE